MPALTRRPYYIYIWADGRPGRMAATVGCTAFPREKRGQFRQLAKAGSRAPFPAYLREQCGPELDRVGKWYTQRILREDAHHLVCEWSWALSVIGCTVLPYRVRIRPQGTATG